jgi:hypothetical protein
VSENALPIDNKERASAAVASVVHDAVQLRHLQLAVAYVREGDSSQ